MVMKVYKVFTSKMDQDYLKNGYVILNLKKKIYGEQNNYSELFDIEKYRVNTFSNEEMNWSMFFFASLVDAVRYVRCLKYAFGNYDKISDFLILEMDIKDNDVFEYLGVGFYHVCKSLEDYLSLEMAIPLKKLEETTRFSLVKNGLWKVINGHVYTNNSDEVIEISKYLEYGDMKVDMIYQEGLLKLVRLLGFRKEWFGLVKDDDEKKNNSDLEWLENRKWEMFMYNMSAMEQRNGKILQKR